MINKKMYDIEKADNVGRDSGLYGSLRVLFREELIGVVQNYSDANDVIEEHAANYKPLEDDDLSQEVVYEREILHLEEKVEYLTSERDYWKGFTTVSADVTKAVDEERKRSWNENKAFQWDLAEQNAELRKKLTEKHDDNCRLQRQLAEGHNKLQDALKELKDLEMLEDSAASRAIIKELERLTAKVNTLWEERYDS